MVLSFFVKIAQETLQCVPRLCMLELRVSAAEESLVCEIEVDYEFWLIFKVSFLSISVPRKLWPGAAEAPDRPDRAPWPPNGSRYDMSCWRKMSTLEGVLEILRETRQGLKSSRVGGSSLTNGSRCRPVQPGNIHLPVMGQ